MNDNLRKLIVKHEKRIHELEKVVARLIDTLKRAECQNNTLKEYDSCRVYIEMEYDEFKEFRVK